MELTEMSLRCSSLSTSTTVSIIWSWAVLVGSVTSPRYWKSSKLVNMAEAKCITLLVHLVDHDHTELVNMDDLSSDISDQLNCQLLVNIADHGSLLERMLLISYMKHKTYWSKRKASPDPGYCNKEKLSRVLAGTKCSLIVDCRCAGWFTGQ